MRKSANEPSGKKVSKTNSKITTSSINPGSTIDNIKKIV